MKITQQLKQKPEAVTVSETTAGLIKKNQQSLLLHSLEMKGNKMCYLLSEHTCHGIINIGTPFKLHLSQFHEYFPKHRCTERQRKLWFPNKKVLFAYPVEIKKPMNIKATVSNTLGELFTDSYELSEESSSSIIEKNELDFSKLTHVSSDSLLVVFNKESDSFIINLQEDTPLAKQMANHLLSTYGPTVSITYGNNFGNTYIPLYEASCIKLQELQEITNLEPVPDLMTEGPQRTTLEFRDKKKYVVEKKFEGTSVRLQCWKGVPEIHELNGRSFTEMFPTISKDLSTVSRGNWIADGILSFDLNDTSVGVQGLRLFSQPSHESLYFIGVLSQCSELTEDTLTITLSAEKGDLLDTLERMTGITIKRELQDESVIGVISNSVLIKDLLTFNMYTKGFYNVLSERFVRSFMRGVVDSVGSISETVSFSLQEEGLASYVSRHISKHLGTSIESKYEPESKMYNFTFKNEEAKGVVNFLYTAGPSIEKMKLRAAELVNSPLCAHPDEAHAVLWIHDLLYHEQW